MKYNALDILFEAREDVVMAFRYPGDCMSTAAMQLLQNAYLYLLAPELLIPDKTTECFLKDLFHDPTY